MKVGCATWSYNREIWNKEIDFFDWLEICGKELKVDGVEIIFDLLPSTEPDYLAEVKARCQELNLDPYCISPGNDFARPTAEERQANVENVQRWTEIGQTLGCKFVRVYSGRHEGDREGRWLPMIECFKQVAEFAGQRGMMCVLENHNHNSYAGTGADVLRIMEAVNSPYLRPLLDTGNFIDGYPSVEMVAPTAAMVHAKIWEVTEEGGCARIDYPRVINLLKSVGFDGYLSIEYESEELGRTAVPRVVRYLRQLVEA